MRTHLLVAVLVVSAGCAKRLPSFPVQSIQDPPAGTFASGRCTVRATPLVFDERTKWGGVSEAEFITTLNTGERGGQQALKEATSNLWLQHLELNSRDYLGDVGGKMIITKGDEAWVLRSTVESVDRKTGGLRVRHEVLSASDNTRVGEFVIDEKNIGNNFRTRVTTAAIPQAWTALAWFGKRFTCGG